MTKNSRQFLIFTFALTYIMWVPLAFLTHDKVLIYGSPLFMIPYLIGGNAPPIVALIVGRKNNSPEEYHSFLKSMINPKHSPIWYLLIIIFTLLYTGIPMILSHGTTIAPLYMIFVNIPVMIIGGGLEEIGWRGVLLPEVMKKFTPFTAALVVGVIWTLWHIPLFYIVGTFQNVSMTILDFALTTIALSFLLTVIYRGTKSIFMCIVFHALINASTSVFSSGTSYVASVIILVCSIVILLVLSPRRAPV